MKHTNIIKKSLLKKTAAVITSVIMLATSLSFPELKDGFKEMFLETSAAVPSGTINRNYPTIYTLKSLYQFSEDYHNDPASFQRAKVPISITEAVEISATKTFDGVEKTWYPIGTEDHPFGGRIEIATTGTSQNFTVNEPLFDQIMDSVEIITTNTTDTQSIVLVRNDDVPSGEDKPLFANKVVKDKLSGATSATWDITTEGTGTNSGVVGTVGDGTDGATVNIDLTLKSSSGIEAENNAGIICGTVKKDSKVNVSISDSSTSQLSSIKSKSENAGGFVGEMCQGSELNITYGNTYSISNSNRTITGKKNAGGLVGKNDQGTVTINRQNGTVNAEQTYEASGSVVADTSDGAAGGIFGYYKVPSSNDKFSPKYYKTSSAGCSLKGKIAGGLVGVLEGNGKDISYSGTPADPANNVAENIIAVVSTLSSSATTYGGIIGVYSNTDLKKTMTIEYVDVTMKSNQATNYGGAVGSIRSDNNDTAVYVKVDNFTMRSEGNVDSCTYFGGVIGSAGSKGSMLDIGNISITTTKNYKGGGVVGQLNAGVLRLSGVTNLSGANASSGGQIVGERTNALVYALGSGNDEGASFENGWKFIRSTNDVAVDDIGTWGEVVRISNIEEKDPSSGTSTSVLLYDSSNHTVKVASAVTDMRSKEDFVKTALNMQLNDGTVGALSFNGSNRSSLLSDKTLTVFGTIDLSGTGITGFMRDGYKSNDSSEIQAFTGTLSKGSHGDDEEDADAVIKLAVGERYGVYSGSENGRGAIHRHKYNGLFARTGQGAAISDITIDGTMNIRSYTSDMTVGGAIAYLQNGATLTSVSAKETINFYDSNSNNTNGQYVGGLVGRTNCAENQNVTIGGTDGNKALIAPTINVTGNLRNNESNSDKTVVYQSIGGLIGFIGSEASAKTTVDNITLSATIDASSAAAAENVSTAGLIADIKWYSSDTRTLELSNIDVKNTSVKNTAANTTGGILGYRWYGTDVTFDNVVIDNGDKNEINEINSSAKYVGGLVYRATGHWLVNDAGITINSIAFKNGNETSKPTGLGIIVHDGYYSNNGLYLELRGVNSYILTSGLSDIPDMTAPGKIYDELCACLADSADHILTNNTAGVISYHTSDDVYTSTEEIKNSYDNVYNTKVVNNRSRYYYNADLDSYTINSSDDGYKLLYWSLNRYAAANIKRCFTNPFSNNVLSGTFDLNHISYYPIDISSDVSIGGSTFVFYNTEIEQSEIDSDTKRSTRDTVTSGGSVLGKSQHYMMHMGLFRNVTATVNTTDNITMSGSVGVNSVYSGALINGTLTGSLNTAAAKNIFLGDANYMKPLEISDPSRYLLINKIGDKAVMNLNGLWINNTYTTSGNTTYASSLIGDVQGTGISLTFNNIKIDARNKEGVSITGSLYGTSRSIFSNATLLNKYDVDSTSVAVYNFSQKEDWGSNSVVNKTNRSNGGKVTFGRELTDSVEYANEEKMYYENGENGNYISPVTYPGKYSSETAPLGTEYDFSSDYLPYVRYFTSDTTKISDSPTATYTLREIRVNVVPSDLTTGCGTYDHPYSITSPKQLSAVSIMLDGTTPIPNIMLPETDNGSHWCCTATDASGNNTYSCLLFTYDSNISKYKHDFTITTTDSETGAEITTVTRTAYWETDAVRKYLASAYYQIGSNIELSTTFTGLGAYDSDYAFKGVIVGINNNTTVTNKTNVPLIKVSNGSVVKDLKIIVNNTGTFGSGGSRDTKFGYSNKYLFYGGVMGEIMGGDNIIDNVSVTYSNNGYVKTQGNSLMCVGGYVGVIVNGGLVFRNMDSNKFISKTNFKVNSQGVSNQENWVLNENNETSHKHLYVNPYIGRVINGYAINETTTYSGDSEKYTLDNSTKNYQIADVNVNVTDNDKLYYNTFKSTDDRVNIPTGQSLFILSLITQSGAGTAPSATDEYAHGIAYDGSNRFDETSAAKNVATHLAQYDKVGTAVFADKAGDYALAAKDTYGSKNAVPYIISHYTKTDTYGNYPARKLTGNTDFMKLSTANGTYNLPKGFRGIGSICRFKQEDVDGKYTMKIYGFDGNNSKVNIDLTYNTYNSDSDNYSYKIYGSSTVYVGFGLFNYLVQKPKGDNRTSYYLDDGYYIGKFTISGSVTVNEYNTSGARQDGEGQNNDNNRKRMPAAAFVAGTGHEKYLNLYRLDLENVTVTGSSNVAGYIGRNNIAENNVQGKTNPNDKVYVFVNACNTTRTKLIGSGGSCGGIVGHSRGGYIDLFVNTAPNGNTADTERRGDDGYFKSTMELDIKNDSNFAESGCGGILGGIRNGYQVHLWVNNVTISGYTDTSKIENTSTTVASSLPSGAGGMFGYVRKAESVIITNCIVKDISVTGPVAGGLFGNIDLFDDKPEYGVSPKIKIYNTKVYAEEKNKFSINGVAFSGGLAGQFISSKTYETPVTGYNNSSFVYDIDGCEVYNYTITQNSNADMQYGAGGMIGYAKKAQRTIVNSRVHDCTIKANADSNKHGMGGVVGNSEYAIWGYNIAAYNNSFEYLSEGGNTLAKYGSFIGNSNSKELKIVGFTRKNNNLGETAVSQDWGNGAGSNSYVIDADYMNVSTTNAHNTAMAVGFDNGTNVDQGAAKNYFPYVTVSPKVRMGGDNFLTGDGVSIYNNSPLAKLIVTENSETAADNRIAYKTVSNEDIANVKELISYGEDTTKDNDIKLTTYCSEMGRPEGYTGDDFPIIAINGAQTNYNAYINAYIRTLTNTTDSYNSDVNEKFTVDIFPCQCISGVYRKVSGTSGFQRKSGNFVMVDSAADSIAQNNQISMIDIRFLDPTDSGKTAYHLYIPVLTKKMLKFNFSSTALQGTEYEPSVYKSNFENNEWGTNTKLGAGFDSWQTIYVQFEYTKNEVNKFLETGKRFNWNTPKELYFEYQGDRSIADSTQYVLLDNNNGADKEYYITKSDAGIQTQISADLNVYDVIKFNEFTTSRNNASQISPSEKFSQHQQTLNEIAGKSVVYTTANNGMYVPCENQTQHSDAIAFGYDKSNPADSNIIWFREYKSGDTQRYNLEVTDDIIESYYLSMYTFGSDNTKTAPTNNAYGFIVRSPMTITSDVITCQRENMKNTEIYLGNFLKQTLIISKASEYVNQNNKISLENNTLNAKLIATVEVDAGDPRLTGYFFTKLTNEKLYQGFLLYLNRYDKDGNLNKESSILGNPTYSIITKSNGQQVMQYGDSIDEGEPYLYIDPIQIQVPEQESSDWKSTQEVEITLTFNCDEQSLINEFTTHSRDSDLSGVEIDASAKLEFVAERVPYSNNIEKTKASDRPGVRYYVDRTAVNGKLTLTALDQPDNDEYDPYGEQSHNRSALGINAKYIDQGVKYSEKGDTEHIDIGMDYDISQLPEEEIFDGNHTLNFTIKLKQKQNSDNSAGFTYEDVNIEDVDAQNNKLGYLENFKFYGQPNSSTLNLVSRGIDVGEDGCLYYTYSMALPSDKQNMAIKYNSDNKHFNANFEFDVRTAAKLEAIPGYKYANYKFEVTAEITGDTNYSSDDHVIYTNAKVNAEYVKKAG